MRRFRVLLAFVVLLAGVLALQAHPVVVAQEATPAVGMAPEGATFAPLGFAQGVALPSPADMIVVRFGLDPGAGFPLEASDPTGGMVVVESGAFTVRVEAMTWTISRGEALSAAMETGEETDFTAAMEQVAMGAEAVLEAGDVAWIPGSVSGEIRNDGQEPAEGLVFLVGPPEAMTAATPAP